jgi:hypothetical protein
MELILIVLVLAALIWAGLTFGNRRPGGSANWPFYAKKPLSNPEQVLYHRLVRALPECIILAQVQLSRVLGVKKGNNFGVWHNRINRMSVDFLICLKDSTVVAAIELDDASHDRRDRRIADAKKELALRSAGLPLIRWTVATLPSEDEIRAAIAK